MQHLHVGLAAFQHLGGEYAAVLHSLVFQRVRETLALHAGHVDDVGSGHDVLDVGVLVVLQSGVFDGCLYRRRELQLGGRNEVECGVEVAHCLHERVYGAAIFQVTNHGYLQVFECALSLADAVEVEHALGGVLVGTVAGVDYRHGGHFGSIARGAFLGVAHDDEVGIACHHDDGVVQRFAFLHACATWVAESDDAGTQLVGSAFEAQACAGRRLEEECCHNLVAENRLFRIFLEFLSDVEHLDVLIFAEVGDGDKVPSF